MVGKAQKSHGARSELTPVFGLEKVDRWNPISTSAIQTRSRPMRFLGFSNHEKGALRKEISKCLTVCSTFSRSGWSVVRNASLVKGSTSKKSPSPHLHKAPTPSNKVSPRTLQTALVYKFMYLLLISYNFPCFIITVKYLGDVNNFVEGADGCVEAIVSIDAEGSVLPKRQA
jgi:hypothetical protein